MWKEQFKEWCEASAMPDGAMTMALPDRELAPLAVAMVSCHRQGSLVVVTPDSAAMDTMGSALDAFRRILGDSRSIISIPDIGLDRRQWQPEREAERCAALEAVLCGKKAIYLATPQVLLSKTLAPDKFTQKSLTLKVGQTISPDELARQLVALDYDNEYEIQETGEFARRGGIFDIYSPLYDMPIRLEFWGDEIDTMRFFMPETQRSVKDVKEIQIIPRGTAALGNDENEQSSVRAFFSPDIPLVLCSPQLLQNHLEEFTDNETADAWKDVISSAHGTISILTEPDEVAAVEDACLLIETSRETATAKRKNKQDERIGKTPASILRLATCLAQVLTNDTLQNEFALLNTQLLRSNLCRWCDSGYTVVACCDGDGEADRFRQIMKEHPSTAELKITIEKLPLYTGLLFAEARLVLLSSKELFGRSKKIRRRKLIDYHFNNALQNDVLDLEEGALAVHAAWGICKYHGIVKKAMGEELVESIELEFADDARLYVPIEQAQLVSRYMGGSKTLPRLSSLSGSAWNRKKEQAASSTWDLAAEMLRMEAMRQGAEGICQSPVLEWENTFVASFPYKETPDQTRAIEEVLKDMADSKPMDRLLCGDVGYGKTEVAMRAAFRAVMNGHQVAVLVPTTVLAQQHYQSFCERMSHYPITIEMLSRFRTHKEQQRILERLETHEIDIVIGTHALVQPSVKFAALGLLIIDEEQRFGVKHKQRLKEMRASIDILTMTATPIPRTLYFSLSGIRNLSTIMTPPADRLPVNTIIAYNDKDLIRQAIMRELERDGQVFFLFNRVRRIDLLKESLEKLVPEARFCIAHGQMTPGELEDIITQFVAHKFDVLVCTTIIESGIDIPNVNTIIIDRADRFGLSELYQLRGRVGRYHRQSYAYLLLPPNGVLPANARERLNAIKRYTQLGAGMKLAMKDLEIRGAGNILGEEQSGHIAAIGFELYCQLLKEAVARLEKRVLPKVIQVPVSFDTVTNSIREVPGVSQACIPPVYITESNVRIEIYKRLNNLTNEDDIDYFGLELEDRFGTLPAPVNLLLELAKVRALCQQKKVIRLSVRSGRLIIETEKGLYKLNGQVPVLQGLYAADQVKETLDILRRLS